MTIAGIHWSAFYLAAEWIIRFAMLGYVPQQRTPAAARTWLLLIFLLPIPGLILYGMIGRIYLPRRRLAMQRQVSLLIQQAQADRLPSPSVHETGSAEPLHSITKLAVALGDFHVFEGNRVELLDDYAGSIDRLVTDIDGARQHVHVLTYIFGDDDTGRSVADALMRASRRGVRCRVLMDAVGSARGLRRFRPALRDAGVDVHAMLPVGLFRRSAARFDLRNHRKISVIDGRVGYIGSQNIVDPAFIPDRPNVELVVRLTGPAVAQLQALFVADYYFESGGALDRGELFPMLEPTGATPAQLLPSGPAYGRENAKDLMVALMYAARRRIVITTPYLIPDDSFLQALQIAALRGVDVRVVVSQRSNQRFAELAQQSYYQALLGAGIRIYLYQPGFLHAKHISVDDEMAMVGSTNVDIRSFSLNAEASLLIYDTATVAALIEVQERYFAASDRLSAEQWANRRVGLRMVQNVARLADSFL